MVVGYTLTQAIQTILQEEKGLHEIEEERLAKPTMLLRLYGVDLS